MEFLLWLAVLLVVVILVFAILTFVMWHKVTSIQTENHATLDKKDDLIETLSNDKIHLSKTHEEEIHNKNLEIESMKHIIGIQKQQLDYLINVEEKALLEEKTRRLELKKIKKNRVDENIE